MPKHSTHGNRIDSLNHPQVKRIRSLQTRAERERTGLFYIEGMRLVAQAIHYHACIETLVLCPASMSNPYAGKLAEKLQGTGTPTLELAPQVMHSIALAADPQGIGAVVRQKWLPLERAKLGGKLCWLAVDAIHSPGNLGSILRTSDSVGGAGLILLGDSTDPYDPATVRATMGALFSQRFVRTTPEELARWKAPRQWQVVGTSPHAPLDYQEVRYDTPTILLVGNEQKGLSEQLQATCDLLVRVPMVGRGDSLNVAVATGVVLYEIFNQRRKPR
ncbi:MAG TPA: RNA methyltransferase [Chloroflexia bacterium]